LYDDPHLQDVEFFGSYDHPSEGKMKIPRPAVWMSETPPKVGNPTTKFSKTNHLASTVTQVQKVEKGRWVVVKGGLMF
jgi:hypothetical protein